MKRISDEEIRAINRNPFIKQTSFMTEEFAEVVADAQLVADKKEVKKMIEEIERMSQIFIAGQDIATEAGNAIKGNISYYPIIPFLQWQVFKKRVLEE